MNIVDESLLVEEISYVLEDDRDRRQMAAAIAGAIRRAGSYRWVGLYEVSEAEIANLAFDGPGAPAHPRFPVTQGLSGSAVASGESVVVNDVREDRRYLTAFGSTRSEIIVPAGTLRGGRSWAPSTSRASGWVPSRRKTAPPWSAARPRSPGFSDESGQGPASARIPTISPTEGHHAMMGTKTRTFAPTH